MRILKSKKSGEHLFRELTDPLAFVRCYLDKANNKLYVSDEVGGTNIDLLDIPKVFREIEGSDKILTYADSSRPETINHVKNYGFYIKRAKKWSGSVEDGITYLRSFDKIIVHSRCKETIKEFKNYSYVVDKKNQRITRKIEDKNNHYIDAIRYAFDDKITIRRGGLGYY